MAGGGRRCPWTRARATAWRAVALVLAAWSATTRGAPPPAAADGRQPTPSRPNVVVILADDLGYGDVACFNADSKIPTPNLDRLAAEGVRFTDAHTASAVCTPTRYALLTGRYAWRTRLTSGVLWGVSPPLIEPGRMTVASLLKRHGYATACIGKWHLGMEWATLDGQVPDDTSGYDVSRIDYTQPIRHGPGTVGFEHFFGIPASLDMVPYCYVRDDAVVAPPTERIEGSGGLAFWRAGLAAPGFRHEDVLATLTEQAVGFVDRHGQRSPGQPFLLYFALTAPHTPVVPRPPFEGASQAGPYGDFVVEVDWVVGRIMETLQRHGVADDTLLIVTSDNGSTMTRASTADYDHAANHIFRGRKSDAWEGGHRVPFIARWPARIDPGRTCDVTIGLTDLLATCAEIVGTTLPDDAGEDSMSILAALEGRAADALASRTLVHHSVDGVFAVRDGPWKLVLARGSGGWSLREKDAPADAPPAQLYDLASDPSETTNLYDRHPEIVERLRRALERCRDAGRSRPVSTP